MKAATVHEIRQELQTKRGPELIELCQRLARFKKENKELLTYLLFEAHNEQGYITSVKTEVDELFETINLSHLYFAKKTLRKIIRVINKYCRYSGIKQTEVELRVYFCFKMKATGIPIARNTVISNIYDGQLKKIMTLVTSLHEDLQHDYLKEIDPLLEESSLVKDGATRWFP